MKRLNLSKIRTIVFFVVAFLTSCSFAKNMSHNTPEATHIASTIKQLNFGMEKSEVISLMGEPYKISFAEEEKDTLIEDFYYKTTIYIEKWYVITYRCSFKKNKLIAISQDEKLFFGKNNVSVSIER